MPNENRRDTRALLDDWRSQGADRANPVRFRLIEAMARRTAAYDGAARQLLEDRLLALVAAYGDALASTTELPSAERPAPPSALSGLTALRECLDLRERASAPATPAAVTPRLAHASEPELAGYFRDTWARVSVDRQMRASQASVPDNAGPLNTNHLVNRALALMRDVSPGYLEQFLSYVDALSWLEGMHAISLVPERKTRGRSGKADKI